MGKQNWIYFPPFPFKIKSLFILSRNLQSSWAKQAVVPWHHYIQLQRSHASNNFKQNTYLWVFSLRRWAKHQGTVFKCLNVASMSFCILYISTPTSNAVSSCPWNNRGNTTIWYDKPYLTKKTFDLFEEYNCLVKTSYIQCCHGWGGSLIVQRYRALHLGLFLVIT